MSKLYHDETWLRRTYCEDKWSQQEIASYCGVTQSTIHLWIEKFNIETKTFSEGKFGSKNGSWLESSYKNYETLYKLYIIQKKSIRDISKESGHPIRTIARWLKDHNIKTRKGSESRTKKIAGELNPNWKDGVEDCPICGRHKSRASNICQFCFFDMRKQKQKERIQNNEALIPVTKSLRHMCESWSQEIFKRDDYTCQSCGDDKSKLNAHHIIPFVTIRDQLIMEYGHDIEFDFSTSKKRDIFLNLVKDDGRITDLDNGITLCESCHIGEHKRLRHILVKQLYVYSATVLDVYDGDSITVELNLGFGLTKIEKIRLFGVDTYELSSKDIHKKGKAIAAKRVIEELCQPGRNIVIRTYKSGKYGRYLAMIFLNHAIINDFLLETGLAEEYIL